MAEELLDDWARDLGEWQEELEPNRVVRFLCNKCDKKPEYTRLKGTRMELKKSMKEMVAENYRRPARSDDELPKVAGMGDQEITEFNKLYNRRPEFFRLVFQMVETANAKGQDYGGKDTYDNLRASEAFGIPAWKGVLVRMNDKWSRIKSFATHNFLAVKDESFEDTLMDLAVYSLLCIVMFRQHKEVGS